MNILHLTNEIITSHYQTILDSLPTILVSSTSKQQMNNNFWMFPHYLCSSEIFLFMMKPWFKKKKCVYQLFVVISDI